MKIDKNAIEQFGVQPRNPKLHMFASQESTTSENDLNAGKIVTMIAPVLEAAKIQKGGSCKCLLFLNDYSVLISLTTRNLLFGTKAALLFGTKAARLPLKLRNYV